VYGFGERKTPDAFVQACDKFIYVEVLRSEVAAQPPLPPAPKPAKKAAKPAAKKPAAQAEPAADAGRHESLPLRLIRQAIEEASDDQGWAFLGSVGSYLNKVRPDFDTRLYGHKKLSDLLKAHPRHFTVEERGGENGVKRIYVRSAG
jgi:hypothetical protein